MLNGKSKNNNGITLVGLVVTIILLLILTTISIQSLTNTGLFAKAQEAKEKTRNAEENQARTLNEYEDELNKYISGNIKTPIKKVADNIGKVLSTTDNTELQDAYGNKIVVPAGFKIVSDDTTNNAQTVDKGIVIEDTTTKATAGSQFVWIPVGTIYTDLEHTESKKKIIELNRYTFDPDGTPTPQDEKIISVSTNINFQELETSNKGNTVAKSITNFKTSVIRNGGYYIGRYEARQKNGKLTENKTDVVQYNIKQPDAAIQARSMYQDSTTFTSDLMNSYAWDTAILFLQTYGTNNKYSRQSSLNTNSLANTGTTDDIQCNVYDIASNLFELTTETSNEYGRYFVIRGGSYWGNSVYSSSRNNESSSSNSSWDGFRPILYIN